MPLESLSGTWQANITEPWNTHRRHKITCLATAQHTAVPGSTKAHGTCCLQSASPTHIPVPTEKGEALPLFPLQLRSKEWATYHLQFWMQKAIHGILSCPALLSEFSQAPKPSPVASRSISNQVKASLRKDMCRYLFISYKITLLKNSMKTWSLKLIKITPDGSWLYIRPIKRAAHKD